MGGLLKRAIAGKRLQPLNAFVRNEWLSLDAQKTKPIFYSGYKQRELVMQKTKIIQRRLIPKIISNFVKGFNSDHISLSACFTATWFCITIAPFVFESQNLIHSFCSMR